MASKTLNIAEYDFCAVVVTDHEGRGRPTFTIRAMLHKSDPGQDELFTVTLGDLEQADSATDLSPILSYANLIPEFLKVVRAKCVELDPVGLVQMEVPDAVRH